ncbi:MAG: DUF11 domain-containing protein [Saprospirales bacterium]|nr:DUF11 domain-containing protein [Saprospirales bacterium]
MDENTPAQDDEDDASVTPKQSDLVLVKEVSPANPNVGDVVTFSIKLSNVGPDPATGVSVEDYVPAGFSAIASISDAGTESGGTVSWSGLSVPVGADTKILTFQATVDAPTALPVNTPT